MASVSSEYTYRPIHGICSKDPNIYRSLRDRKRSESASLSDFDRKTDDLLASQFEQAFPPGFFKSRDHALQAAKDLHGNAENSSIGSIPALKRDSRVIRSQEAQDSRVTNGDCSERKRQRQSSGAQAGNSIVRDASTQVGQVSRWLKALELRREGRLQDALDEFRAMTRSAKTHFNIGQIYFQLEQWTESAREFEKAIELDFCFAIAYMQLGKCMAHMRHISDALAHFQSSYSWLRGNVRIDYRQLGLACILTERQVLECLAWSMFHEQRFVDFGSVLMHIASKLSDVQECAAFDRRWRNPNSVMADILAESSSEAALPLYEPSKLQLELVGQLGERPPAPPAKDGVSHVGKDIVGRKSSTRTPSLDLSGGNSRSRERHSISYNERRKSDSTTDRKYRYSSGSSPGFEQYSPYRPDSSPVFDKYSKRSSGSSLGSSPGIDSLGSTSPALESIARGRPLLVKSYLAPSETDVQSISSYYRSYF